MKGPLSAPGSSSHFQQGPSIQSNKSPLSTSNTVGLFSNLKRAKTSFSVKNITWIQLYGCKIHRLARLCNYGLVCVVVYVDRAKEIGRVGVIRALDGFEEGEGLPDSDQSEPLI